MHEIRGCGNIGGLVAISNKEITIGLTEKVIYEKEMK